MESKESMIKQALQDIEKDHQVCILYACEAGSRAWGIESEDSDYDVRFIYVRPKDIYLSLDIPRDVIELPIVDDLDVNGWDIYKALRLLRKSNSALIEWLFSPIIYLENSSFIQGMRNIARSDFAPRVPMHYHYSRMAESNFKKYIKDRSSVWLKKYLYVVRPIVMLLYIEQHNEMPPTVNFPQVIADVDLPDKIQAHINVLIARKQAGDELHMGEPDAVLNAWIEEHLTRWKTHISNSSHDPDAMRWRTESLLRLIFAEREGTLVTMQWESSEMVQQWICQHCKKPQQFFDPRQTVWLKGDDERLNICAQCYKELTRAKQIAKEAL